MSETPAAADCELISNSFWGQPVNSISSLAFVLVGLLLVQRRPVLGWAAIAAGVGSFLFHGPMPGWAEWAHDVSLAMVPVAIAFEARPKVVLAMAGAIALVFAFWLAAAEVVTAILVIEAAAVVWARRETVSVRPAALAFALLGAGVLVSVLSRTDGQLCDPDSLLQGHAVWHVLGASALWVWARATSGASAAAS